MSSNLQATKKGKTLRISSTTETKSDMPPEGAKITRQNVSTSTEQIENGWLITKNFDGKYTIKGEKDDYGHYYNYSKKWYSKDDPLTVTLNDKTLSDAFNEDEINS